MMITFSAPLWQVAVKVGELASIKREFDLLRKVRAHACFELGSCGAGVLFESRMVWAG